MCVLYFPIRTRGFPLVIFLFEDVVTFGSSATGFKSVGSDVDVACPGDVLGDRENLAMEHHHLNNNHINMENHQFC